MTAAGQAAWRRALPGALSLAAVAAAFAHALAVSWRKWGLLFVDVGRELELPRQLLEGARLYGDVRAYYGPLAYWVNEGLYALFGVHADVLAGAGILSAAAYALLAWWLARALAGDAAAALVGAAVAEVCLFPHLFLNPSFNFALPYAFPATYGALALLATTAGLVQHARTGKAAPFALAAAALAAVALTKVELLAAGLAAHAVFAAAAGRRGLGRLHLAGWGLALLVPAAIYGAFYLEVGDALWTDSLGANFNPYSSHFFRGVAGLQDVPASLELVGGSALAFAATGALAAGAAWLAARPALPRPAAWLVAPAAAAAAALGWSRLDPEAALRALPLALLAALAALGWRAWRSPERRAGLGPELVLAAAGLGSLLRQGLAAGPRGYGFYLLPPALLALGVIGMGRLAKALAPAGAARLAAAAPVAGLLLGVAWPVMELSREHYALHTEVLETPRGRFEIVPDGAGAVVPLLAELPPGTRTVVIPQGAGWVFAAGQPWGDGTHSYLPLDLVGGYDDEQLVARWAAAPPEVVVMVHGRLRDAAEFGSGPFGLSYGRRLGRFIELRYEVLVPPGPDGFFSVLQLRRRR